jgi:hypothetical protein
MRDYRNNRDFRNERGFRSERDFNTDYIEFNKKRNLGMMLGDTINFLTIERGGFFNTVLKISIIPMILAVASGVFYQLYDLNKPDFYDNSFFAEWAYLTEWQFLLATLFEYTAYGFMTASAYSYIKSYAKNKGRINFPNVQKEATQKGFPYAVLYTLTIIVIYVGLLFLAIPGIYFGIVLSLAGCILVFDDMNVFDAFGDSFNFIKGHWWETFGCILVFQILVIIIAVILSLPVIFYGFNDLFGEQPSFALIEELSSDPIYISLLALAEIVDLLIYLVSAVFIAFIYFDIREQKYPSEDAIDSIGRE